MDPEFKPHILAALELVGSEPNIDTRAWWDNLGLVHLQLAQRIYDGFSDFGEDLIRVRTEHQSYSQVKARIRALRQEADAMEAALPNQPLS